MMIKILASQNLKNQASKTLKTVFDACNSKQDNSIAFISRELYLKDFMNITEKKEEHLVYDFTDITDEGRYLNGTISLPLSSMLFIDLSDKSLYKDDFINGDLEHFQTQEMIIQHINQTDKLKPDYKIIRNIGTIDIVSIRKMIITLKYKYNLKDIYIDNFDRVSVKDFKGFENQEFVTEYKLAIFFYMSKKFNLNFHIGMELIKDEQKPKFIKHLTYGNSFDMIDKIEYN